MRAPANHCLALPCISPPLRRVASATHLTVQPHPGKRERGPKAARTCRIDGRPPPSCHHGSPASRGRAALGCSAFGRGWRLDILQDGPTDAHTKSGAGPSARRPIRCIRGTHGARPCDDSEGRVIRVPDLQILESRLSLSELPTGHEPPWLGVRALARSEHVETLSYPRTA
jgi:hypothetical protein